MADQNKKTDAEKTIETLKAQLAQEKEKNAKLEKELAESASSGKAAKAKIRGALKIKIDDLEGNEKEVTIRFKDGTSNVRIPKVSGINGMVGEIIDSELLFKIANGQKLAEKEAKLPVASSITKERAQAILKFFYEVKASFIK